MLYFKECLTDLDSEMVRKSIIPGAARVGPEARPAAAIVNSPVHVLGYNNNNNKQIFIAP